MTFLSINLLFIASLNILSITQQTSLYLDHGHITVKLELKGLWIMPKFLKSILKNSYILFFHIYALLQQTFDIFSLRYYLSMLETRPSTFKILRVSRSVAYVVLSYFRQFWEHEWKCGLLFHVRLPIYGWDCVLYTDFMYLTVSSIALPEEAGNICI